MHALFCKMHRCSSTSGTHQDLIFLGWQACGLGLGTRLNAFWVLLISVNTLCPHNNIIYRYDILGQHPHVSLVERPCLSNATGWLNRPILAIVWNLQSWQAGTTVIHSNTLSWWRAIWCLWTVLQLRTSGKLLPRSKGRQTIHLWPLRGQHMRPRLSSAQRHQCKWTPLWCRTPPVPAWGDAALIFTVFPGALTPPHPRTGHTHPELHSQADRPVCVSRSYLVSKTLCGRDKGWCVHLYFLWR